MQTKTNKRSRIALLAAGLLALPLALAGCGGEADPTEEQTQAAVVAPNFDITKIGIQGGLPYILVAGKAGGTQPSATSPDIYAYVYVTDKGTFAIASHNVKDSIFQIGQGDRRWHAHRVTLDAQNCITSIADTGVPQISGNKVMLVYTLITTFKTALTVKLSPVGAKTCVTQVFDSFSL